MHRMLTTLERRAAARDLELARRQLARSRRFQQRADLGPAVREQLAADIADLERECSILGTLLGTETRSGWTMARFAGPTDSIDERPYQDDSGYNARTIWGAL
jgi:hypothetical protein